MASKQGLTIRNFQDGLSGVRSVNEDVKLSVVDDCLFMEYPNTSASCDVWCAAIETNWSQGDALTFRVKPSGPMRLAVSFMDKNAVAYTAWRDLTTEWQTIVIPFDDIQIHPRSPPTTSAIDVSDVNRIGFAPVSESGLTLTIGPVLVVSN